MAQQQRSARSVGARGGHEGPGGQHRALTPRLSPLLRYPNAVPAASAEAVDAAAPQGRKERALRELGKPRRTRFPTAPTAEIFLLIKINTKRSVPGPTHRRASRICQVSMVVDTFAPGRSPTPVGTFPPPALRTRRADFRHRALQWNHAARTRVPGHGRRAGLASPGTGLAPLRRPAGASSGLFDALATATTRVVPFACACDDVPVFLLISGVIGRRPLP